MVDEAIAAFERVVQQNPNDACSHYHLGTLYARKKMRDRAVGEFMRAVQLDPNDKQSLEELQQLQGK
jgi:cytochrome c-type biogenesis protein CcmH/NrfG